MIKNTDSAESAKPWYKKWWGVLLIIAILPLAVSYWITKQDWSRNIKLLSIGLTWMVFFFFIGANKIRTLEQKQGQAVAQVASPATQPSPTLTPTPSPTLTPSPSPLLSPSPTPEPTPQPVYNKNHGNNYVAAKIAEEFMDVFNGAVDGSVTDIMLELSPEEVKGEEDTYLDSISSIFLQVEMDYTVWNIMNESQQKDVVVSMINGISNRVGSGFPHVYVSNGVRRVAEGSMTWSGEPKVEFK